MAKIEIRLHTPEEIDGKKIEVLELREPIGADLEEIIGEFSVEDKKAIGRAITELASQLIVNAALTPDDIRRFNAKNYMKLVSALTPFLS